MRAIVDVACGDQYTADATIEYQYEGAGGYFQISNEPAFVQLSWGVQGSDQWTNEFWADPCNGSVGPGVIGIRFRNAVPGRVSTVSAGLSLHEEPVVVALPG